MNDMAQPRKELAQSYGSWTVLARDPADVKKALCRCTCGIERAVFVPSLRNGQSKSCGHEHYEAMRRGTQTPGLKHGQARKKQPKTGTYRTWERLGAKGLRPDCWGSFEAFLADMGKRPDDADLRRIDRQAAHGPTNSQWVLTAP